MESRNVDLALQSSQEEVSFFLSHDQKEKGERKIQHIYHLFGQVIFVSPFHLEWFDQE